MEIEVVVDEEIDDDEEDDAKEEEEEESIYSENIRDTLLEDDELSPMEVAFMKGYDEAYRP